MVIKARLVVLQGRLRASTRQHIRYLQREELGRPHETCRAYGAETDVADTAAFEERSTDDRHQFRFIVSAEDGAELGELREFTRTLMQRMAQDLGTELEWLAVDHHDTDNPHTHILLRGKTHRGDDLVIARDYISRGMRHRAQELATAWLGPRTEREILASRFRDVQAERFTGLDRALLREINDGVIDLRILPDHRAARERRSLALGRLGHLAKLGLAEEQRSGIWALRVDTESALRAIGERGDIVRTVQRALGPAGNDFVIFDPMHSAPVTGRVAVHGLADEGLEQGYLVLEGVDGRVHYLRLSRKAPLRGYPVGAIVSATGKRVSVVSRLSLDQQNRAIGATWLDQELLAGSPAIASRRFGAEVNQALAVRAQFLIDEGFIERHDGRLSVRPDLIATLRDRELGDAARRIVRETGLAYRTLRDGQPISGTFRRSLQLVSGRFAVIENGAGFSLVPWQPTLEQHLGAPLQGYVRGGGIEWTLGRSRGLSR